jgi:hypothetical protein
MSDNLSLRVEIAVLRLLAEITNELPPDGLHIQAQAGHWRIAIAIGPAAVGASLTPGDKPLTTCEQECLDCLVRLHKSTGRRQTAREINAALRADGRRWGWATLTAALGNLVAIGRLVNPRDKRGYGLPEAELAATDQVKKCPMPSINGRC